MPETLWTLLGMLAAVAAVLVLAYFATRFIAGRGLAGQPRTGRGLRNLRLLEQMPLGKDERLAVVELGERCLLLGVAPSGVTLLAELTQEERKLWQPPPGGDGGTPSFQEALKMSLNQRFGKR